MKKNLLIFVAIVLGVRLFAAFMVKLVNTPSDKISTVLQIQDGSIFDFLRKGNMPPPHIKQTYMPVPKIILKPKVAAKPLPLLPKISKKDAAKLLAANELKKLEEKKAADDKKEQERRKKRRKKLETLANQGPQTPPPTPFVAYQPIPDTSNQAVPTGNFNQAQPQKPTTPAGAAGTTPTTAAVQAAATSSASQLAYYTLELVKDPTPTLMQSFTNLYHSGKFTPAQYYRVLDAMIKSTVPEARQLAVTAATQAPRAESFEILAQESYTETVTQIQSQATQGLQAYENINDVSIFSQELSSGSLQGQLRAGELLDQLLKGFITNKNPPANAGTVLSPLVAVLEPLAHNSNQEIQANATTALQDLQQLPGIVAIN